MAMCNSLTGLTSVGDFLVWPTGCFYYFWLLVLVVIFITLTLILYNREKEDLQAKPDIISSFGVSSLVTFILATIGTLIQNADGIPMVQSDVFLYIFAVTVVFMMIWFFKK